MREYKFGEGWQRVKREFAVYKNFGFRTVHGWLDRDVLEISEVLDRVQRDKGVSGSVAEIGVHRGKLFIGLSLLRRQGESAVAIDIFDDQELNIDHSGLGNLKRFKANVERWASLDGVKIHQGDSTKVQTETLRELAGSDIRFFSVDGGHTEEIVLSDMRLAESVLADGGVVIADDVFNEHWPGVSVAIVRYLDEGGKLVPFLVGFNKMFLAHPDYVADYRAAVEAAFEGSLLDLSWHSAGFAGHPVTIVAHRHAIQVVTGVLKRSKAVRALYTQLTGRTPS